jgi:hypothetical protein
MYLKGGEPFGHEGARYGEMYASLANAVNAAGLKVTLLFNSFGGGWITKAVAAVPSLKTLVDDFSNHPYGLAFENQRGEWGPGAMEQQHGEAVSMGFAHANYYVTEIGIEDNSSDPHAGSSGPAQQAERIKADYQELVGLSWVRGIWYYQVHDDSTGTWGLCEQETGSSPFTARPALAVVSSFAKQQGQ